MNMSRETHRGSTRHYIIVVVDDNVSSEIEEEIISQNLTPQEIDIIKQRRS